MIKKKKTNIGEIWKKSLKKFLKISLLSLTYNKKKRAINAGEKIEEILSKEIPENSTKRKWKKKRIALYFSARVIIPPFSPLP